MKNTYALKGIPNFIQIPEVFDSANILYIVKIFLISSLTVDLTLFN